MGDYVAVPFGGRVVGAYVVATDVTLAPSVDPGYVKRVTEVFPGPFLAPHAHATAEWIAAEYAAPLSESLRLFAPPGHSFKIRSDGAGGYTISQPTVRAATERWVCRAPTQPGDVDLSRAPRQHEIYDALSSGPRSVASLRDEFGDGASGAVAALVAKGLVSIDLRRRFRGADTGVSPVAGTVELNEQQRSAVLHILCAVEQAAGHRSFNRPADVATSAGPAPSDSRVLVLDGVTGSGKTEVYLCAITEVLRAGGGAIVLVPEISLTPQTVGRFRGRFGDQVAVLHSRLSAGERLDEWDRVMTGECRVVVGARSALFAPVHNLQLIVIDEEHDGSYKQDSTPRYHARDVAAHMADSLGLALVVGSATPSAEARYRCQMGEWQHLVLSERATGAELPAVEVVDLTEEFAAGERSMISRQLSKRLGQTREAGRKAILFLNRRGFANFLLCRECGYVPSCTRCATSLTYHEHGHQLRCHHCGIIKPVPATCPECGSRYLRQFGGGTQRLQAEFQAKFPGWPTVRMDADTTTDKGAHDRLLREFASLETGVLIGTQMIAKGLDFPEVTLVGIVSADTTLNMPDYLAGERTYQLLEQVAGRAGRDAHAGTVVLQTYQPDHPAVQAVAQHDRELFYVEELTARSELGYPPFQRLCNIEVSGTDLQEVRTVAAQVAQSVESTLLVHLGSATGPATWAVMGPAPCVLSRIKSQYRMHLLLKVPRGTAIGQLAAAAIKDAAAPRGVRVIVDVDPLSLM